MINQSLFLSFALFLSACATTHPGIEGRTMSTGSRLPLKLSAQTIEDEGGNDSFQLIEVTLENTSDKWVKINKARYIIHDPAESKLSVVLGEDLKHWAEAVANKRKLEQTNKEMLQIGLVGLGAVAALSGSNSNNSGLVTAGGAVMVGASAWVVGDVIEASINSAERSEKVPDNHLYHSVSIPAKMFLRRWILLNVPSDSVVKTMMIELEAVDGEKEVYAFDF